MLCLILLSLMLRPPMTTETLDRIYILLENRKATIFTVGEKAKYIGDLMKYYHTMPFIRTLILREIVSIEGIVKSTFPENQDKILNKLVALGIEIDKRGVNDEAWKYHRELYKTYRESYHDVRFEIREVRERI